MGNEKLAQAQKTNEELQAAFTSGQGEGLGSEGLKAQVAELEAKLDLASQTVVRSDADLKEERLRTTEMAERVASLEQDLERKTAALQDATARAAERLEAQAVREREIETRLASLGSVDGKSLGVRFALGVAGGMSTLVTSATGRCFRPNREVDQEGVSLADPTLD